MKSNGMAGSPSAGKGRAMMVVGTGSDVGKSVINAAFCRIFLQDGYRPAPFKAQNMSLNSYATPEGLEIGRAQAVQAEACGIACSVDMNPVLLKPTGELTSQVVLNGKPAGNQSARQYFHVTDRAALFNEAMKACYRLMNRYDPVVIEGAGSISEMNLWDKDITNMRVAETLEAPTLLVADIDRGGVFASVYGSVRLLPPRQRKLIKGIIINKFRGDIGLFSEGKTILEKITGKPVLGVIPYFTDIHLEQEDSVVLDLKNRKTQPGKINVAVVQLKHLSNFTDFNLLEQLPEVQVFYTNDPVELTKADIIMLPGSKNTIADLLYLRHTGLEKIIVQHHQRGKAVYGICGGYQMMGQWIEDLHRVEGHVKQVEGLGILPVTTVITPEKKTEQCRFRFLNGSTENRGYEIHMGVTRSETGSPLCKIKHTEVDGYYLNAKTFGTYIHGIFDNAEPVQFILSQVKPDVRVRLDYQQFKEEQYEKLAAHVRRHVNMDYIRQLLGL